MNYIKLVIANIKNWRAAKKLLGKQYGFTRKFPSQIYYKYPRNSTFNGKRVLNLGCGGCTYPAPNVVNLDAFAGPGVNVVHDLAKMPLPFADNTFDFIIANHVMEHIPGWWDCFQEMARVVKVGGEIEVWVPPISSDSAFAYRDHINLIGPESFYGIGDLNRPGTNLTASKELQKMSNVQRLHVKALSHRLIITWWTMLAPESLAHWMATYLRNVVSEDGYVFKKL